MTIEFDTTTRASGGDGAENRLIICFLHDHLKEVQRVQCKVIESLLLGEEFITRDVADELRATAAVYLAYAGEINRQLARGSSLDSGAGPGIGSLQ